MEGAQSVGCLSTHSCMPELSSTRNSVPSLQPKVFPHFPHPPLHNAVCLVNCDEADACAAVQRLQLRQAVDCQLGGDVDEQVLQVWPGVGKCK